MSDGIAYVRLGGARGVIRIGLGFYHGLFLNRRIGIEWGGFKKGDIH